MPPPPCELSVIVRPSMLDGLHQKLLVNLVRLPVGEPALGQYRFVLVAINSVVPVGKPAANVGSKGFDGENTPFERTVMPAPSKAPIKLGSCSSSARFPLRPASQPTVDSNGKR